jgi:hypothetical protein
MVLFTRMFKFCTIFDLILNIAFFNTMKRVVFTVSEELLDIVEEAIMKLGLSTRAEFFKHSALVFLQQTGFLGGANSQPQINAPTEEEVMADEFDEHQKKLAEFLTNYNREHGTNFPLPRV